MASLFVVVSGFIFLSCGATESDAGDLGNRTSEAVEAPTTTEEAPSTSNTVVPDDEESSAPSEEITAFAWLSSGVTSDAAALTFRTDTCVVARLTLEPGGSADTSDTWPDASSGCVIDHVFFFSDLSPGTKYRAVVEMRDRDGNTGTGSYDFSTEELDPGEIVVSEWETRDLTPTSVTFHFFTNNCASPSWKMSPGDFFAQVPEWPDASVRCFTDFTAPFTGLVPGTEYDVTVSLADRHGNIQDFSYSFSTPVS